LLAAIEIAGIDDVRVLVAGSDGVDGTGPWAGAVVDGETQAKLARAGVDPWRALATSDSGSALDAVGATIAGGPTGVNHADLVIVAR
jgi:hydroxypyruvate reductase